MWEDEYKHFQILVLSDIINYRIRKWTCVTPNIVGSNYFICNLEKTDCGTIHSRLPIIPMIMPIFLLYSWLFCSRLCVCKYCARAQTAQYRPRTMSPRLWTIKKSDRHNDTHNDTHIHRHIGASNKEICYL